MKIKEIILEKDHSAELEFIGDMSAALLNLRAKIIDSDYRGEITMSAVLKALEKAGVKGIDAPTLIDLVDKRSPLVNTIANINKNTVTFVGNDTDAVDIEDDEEEVPPEETIDKMAKRASKKRK